jgi:hypothetical protein
MSNVVARLFAIPGLLAMQLIGGARLGIASDLKVPLPQRSVSTPTQKLNREGVV